MANVIELVGFGVASSTPSTQYVIDLVGYGVTSSTPASVHQIELVGFGVSSSTPAVLHQIELVGFGVYSATDLRNAYVYDGSTLRRGSVHYWNGSTIVTIT